MRVRHADDATVWTIDATRLIDMREKIWRASGVLPNDQQLRYLGVQLDGDSLCEEYGLHAGCVIDLIPRYTTATFQIFVETPRKRTVTVDVLPAGTVQSVKRHLEETEDIPFERQQLTYAGRHVKDGSTFASLGLGNGSTLILTVTPHIVQRPCPTFPSVNVAITLYITSGTRVEIAVGYEHEGNPELITWCLPRYEDSHGMVGRFVEWTLPAKYESRLRLRFLEFGEPSSTPNELYSLVFDDRDISHMVGKDKRFCNGTEVILGPLRK